MLFFRAEDLNDEQKSCFIDLKTGLNSAAGLFYLMDNLHKQYERYEENWSFMIFRADVNKNINANEDKITQDDVNVAIAGLLKKICRSSDILAYCGDNRFCILTRVFEGDNMVQFIKKIIKNLKNIEYKDFIIDVGAKFGLTFSRHKDNVEEFFLRANNALEKAENTNEDIVLNV